MDRNPKRPFWLSKLIDATNQAALAAWRSDPELGQRTSLMHLRAEAMARELCVLAEELRRRCAIHSPETRQFLDKTIDPLAELPARLGQLSGPK